MEPKTTNNVIGTAMVLIGFVVAYKIGKKVGYEDALKDAIRLIEYRELSQK